MQLRGLEEQLEEEYEERQKVNREKKELEKKLQSALQERPARDKGMVGTVRRDVGGSRAVWGHNDKSRKLALIST